MQRTSARLPFGRSSRSDGRPFGRYVGRVERGSDHARPVTSQRASERDFRSDDTAGACSAARVALGG
nr:MAG: hypothetical protein DIU78_26270 [Pseudomonadota bacterium]